MNEKPEALRLADDLETFHSAKKEMPSVGGQMLGLESYRVVATGEVFSRVLDAAAELRRQHAENERLREELRQSSIDHTRAEVERLRGLLTEARGAKWLVVQNNLLDRIDAALRREEP